MSDTQAALDGLDEIRKAATWENGAFRLVDGTYEGVLDLQYFATFDPPTVAKMIEALRAAETFLVAYRGTDTHYSFVEESEACFELSQALTALTDHIQEADHARQP